MVKQQTAAHAPSSGTEVRLFGPVMPSDLAGQPVTDELSLTLASSPAYVLRDDVAGGSTRYTVVLGQPLGRRALMDLLYTLAPYKAHGLDRFSRVLDNWGIHDRAAANGTSNGLFQQHANSLKNNWQVFTEHRRVFMSVFEDQSEHTRVLPIITWQKDAAGKRRWRFDQPDVSLLQVVPDLQEAGDPAMLLDPVVGLVCIPYFLPELYRKWSAWRPLVKNGKSNYIGPASVPMMALMHRRAILNSRFIAAAEALASNGD